MHVSRTGGPTFPGFNTPDTKGYVGLSEQDALARAAAKGVSARVKVRDGIPQVVTFDMRPDRLNFVVQGGRVVAEPTLG